MIFGSDRVFLEIFVDGYGEDGNSLSCQVAFVKQHPFACWVIWDELLRAEDLSTLSEGVRILREGLVEDFSFHSEGDLLTLGLHRAGEMYFVQVSVQSDTQRPIHESFSLSGEAVKELEEELTRCAEEYPARAACACSAGAA